MRVLIVGSLARELGQAARMAIARGARLVQATGDFVYPTYEMAKRMTGGLDLSQVKQFFRTAD